MYVKAGAFQVWLPDGTGRPDHEKQAVGISGRLIPVPGGMCLASSRKDWMEFVAAVKRGELDVEVPDA